MTLVYIVGPHLNEWAVVQDSAGAGRAVASGGPTISGLISSVARSLMRNRSRLYSSMALSVTSKITSVMLLLIYTLISYTYTSVEYMWSGWTNASLKCDSFISIWWLYNTLLVWFRISVEKLKRVEFRTETCLPVWCQWYTTYWHNGNQRMSMQNISFIFRHVVKIKKTGLLITQKKYI